MLEESENVSKKAIQKEFFDWTELAETGNITVADFSARE
jgi:hypothetical protein